MSFDPSIYDSVPAPPEGDYPERFVFSNPGDTIEGTLVDVRKHASDKYDPCIVHDIQGPTGQSLSVFCTTTSQRRLVNSKRPVPGQQIRWTFNGFEGQAKVFSLDIAGGSAPAAAPAAAPAPQPAAPPATAAPAWGAAAPAAPAPAAPAAAPAWG